MSDIVMARARIQNAIEQLRKTYGDNLPLGIEVDIAEVVGELQYIDDRLKTAYEARTSGMGCEALNETTRLDKTRSPSYPSVG